MSLTELRASDRAKMADQVEALVKQFGYRVERMPRAYGCILDITTLRGLCLTVEFDGKSVQPDVHVIPWHVRGHPDTWLSPKFGCVGGEINTVHHQKCTAVRWGFEALMSSLRVGFTMVRTGEAFQMTQPAITQARQAGQNTRSLPA